MAFKIKDGIRVGIKDVFDNSGYLLVPNITGSAKFVRDATVDGLKKDGIEIIARDGGTGSYKVTLSPAELTDNRTQTLQDKAGALALLTNTLNQFASTTSAQLAEIISDETGSGTGGVLVFSNAPTISSPVIDNIAASATTATADLWSEVTTGSVTIGDSLSTGTLNLAAGGSGVNSINIGNPNSIITIEGTLSFVGDFDIGIDNATVLGTDADGNIIAQTTTGSTTTVVLATSPTFVSSVATSSVSFDVFNTTATTINAFGAATTINLATNAGSASAITVGPAATGNDLKINGTTSSTTNLSSAVTTGTVNAFTGITTGTLNLATGGASVTNIGGAGGSVNIGTTGGNSTVTINGNGTGGTATVTTNVTSGVVNLFTGVTKVGEAVGTINIGGADSHVITGGNVTVTGNLTVNGTTTTVESTIVTIEDPIFTLGGTTAPDSDDSKDRGIEFRWHDGTNTKIGFFGFDDSTGKFTFIPNAVNEGEVFSGDLGTIDAKLEFTNLLNRPNYWSKVTAGGTDIEPDSEADTLTVSAGLGINVTGNAGTDTITVSQDGSASAYSKGLTVTANDGSVTTALDSWAIGNYRAAKYIVTITQGSFYQTSEIMVFNNGVGAEMTEYAVFSTEPTNECLFGATVVDTNVVLTGKMVLTASAKYTMHRILMAV